MVSLNRERIFFLSILLVTKGTFGFETRIIGGKAAFAGQFPFAAAINVQTNNSKFFCGGTLTANQWVLTAGHCVYNAVLFTIQLGSNQLVSNDTNRVTLATSTYILHPDFDPDSVQNDIGLIKLRISLDYHIYLHPIHPTERVISEESFVYVPGWGQISDHDAELSNELMYFTTYPITNQECRQIYGSQITDNMICIIGNYNEGTCHGDNGGALAVQNGRTYSVVGVASFVSSDGCESTHPSGFTRTAPYYQWIVNITHETD